MNTRLAVLSLGAALLVGAAGPVFGTDYFTSNEIGMTLAAIPNGSPQSAEWVLAVDRNENQETRILFHDGTENTRWVERFSGLLPLLEEEYQNGDLVERTTFRRGLPTKIEELSGGSVVSTTTTAYAGSAPVSTDVYGPDGALQYRDVYERGADGRLLRDVRSFPDDTRSVSAFTYSDGSVATEWLGSGGNGLLYRYDGTGTSIERWNGTKLQTQSRTAASSAGSESVENDYATNTIITRTYDAQGKIVQEVQTSEGIVVSTTSYSYANGRLASQVTVSGGSRVQVRYTYDAKGTLVETDTSKNRRLQKTTVYTGENQYYEDLYSGGQPVLRVYYADGAVTRTVPLSADPAAASPSSSGGAKSAVPDTLASPIITSP